MSLWHVIATAAPPEALPIATNIHAEFAAGSALPTSAGGASQTPLSASSAPSPTVNPQAIEKHFSPALFGTGQDSLLATLQCPTGHRAEKPVTVFCQVGIGASGRTHDAYCFTGDKNNVNYRRAVWSAIDTAVFIPASLDGTQVPVYMSLRVLIDWSGDTCQLIAIPNVRPLSTDVGNAFVAPQEIRTGFNWIERSDHWHSQFAAGHGPLFEMSVAVAADGTASDARMEKNNGVTRAEANSALHALATSKFIPAFIHGRPIASRYHEWLYIGAVR